MHYIIFFLYARHMAFYGHYIVSLLFPLLYFYIDTNDIIDDKNINLRKTSVKGHNLLACQNRLFHYICNINVVTSRIE